LATKFTYDPVKAAEASALIKSGVDEEEALRRVGIPEPAWGAYTLDDIAGSPTRGQLVKGFGDGTVTVYTEEEEKAMAAAEAKKNADREAERERRAKERESEKKAEIEKFRKEREEERAAAKRGWSDEEDNAETTGPVNTRKGVTTTTSGGGVRETRMTAEMSDWSDKNRTANKADEAATTAAKNEYLKSKGLDQAPFREKSKALREAEASGTNFNVTTNRDALGPPPANQYEEKTIRPNVDGKQVANDGTMTADQAANESAAGQTAESKIRNENISPEPGVGSTSPKTTTDPTPVLVPAAAVSVAEADKIKNNQNRGQSAEELPPNAFPAPPPSESRSSEDVQSVEKNRQGTIVGATSKSSQSSTNQTDNQKQKELSIKLAPAKKNKLHDYTSSTYRFTLYLLSAEDYTALIDRPDTFNPQYVLISSGGGFPNTPEFSMVRTGKEASGRHLDFQEDFFIENLSLTTVVGLNAKTKASNAIEIGFTIVEPYGMTLLDRLQSACSMPPVNSPNYIDQPYLLEIDFLSNVEEAKSKSIRIDRKRLAIKIIEMKIKPGPGGTEYRCRAIPFNHVAFQDSIAALPVALSVQAGTVGEFFDSGSEIAKIFSPEIEKDLQRIESELEKWSADQTNKNQGTKPTIAEINEERNRRRASSNYTTKSYPAGYNTFMRGVSGPNKTFAFPPSLIAFNIPDEKIKKSKIVDEKFAEFSKVPMADPVESMKASVRNSPILSGKTKQGFNINPGINIVQLIDRIMQSSEYIEGQVKEAKEAIAKNREIISNRSNLLNDANQVQIDREQLTKELREAKSELNRYKFLNWYKIIPQVYLLNFDSSRNAYSKQVVYTIVPYKAANAYHPDFAKTKIGKSKIVRSYNYLYTGLNQDITSIDIDFDSLYYTSITAYQDNKTVTSSYYQNPNQGPPNTARDADPTRANPVRVNDLNTTIQPRGVNQKGSGQVNRSSKKDASAVADIAESIYTSSRGDMLNVQLRIIGDPAFIKQDDIYYNPMSPAYQAYSTSSQTTVDSEETVPINPSTGQILFDQEQVFVQLLIKSAVDIDDDTGITNKQIKLSNGRMTDSTFSGVYKLLKVKSDFNRGKFEQTLELVKMPNDLFYDDIPQSTPKVELKTQVAQTETTTPTPTPVVGTGLIAGDETQGGQVRAGEQERLKEAAAQTPTNPVAAFAGEGTVIASAQPTQAAPSNVNDAPAIAPQEKAPVDSKLALDQTEAAINDLDETRAVQLPVFNGELDRIRNDNTLSASEKADKVIALREGLQATFKEQANQIAQLSISTFNTQTEVGSDQSLQKLKMLTRLSNLQKQTTEFFQAQTARIETVKRTGIA
jgi:hypothetical protein